MKEEFPEMNPQKKIKQDGKPNMLDNTLKIPNSSPSHLQSLSSFNVCRGIRSFHHNNSSLQRQTDPEALLHGIWEVRVRNYKYTIADKNPETRNTL